jgi:threonine 3-dehydrogenase
MTAPSTILITGGNGNLGRLVAERFEARGSRVVSFDLPGTESDLTRARHAVVNGDIRDTALLASTIAGHKPDAIIHLASLLSGSSEADPEAAWEINASAAMCLMRLAAERARGPFVFASTIATYGPGVPRNLPEEAPQWPVNVYGVTKIAVERMGGYLKAKQGLDFRCLRFPMVLSPFAPPGAVTAYPSHAFKAATTGEPFTFPVAPSTGMSTMFLDDVIRSLTEITLADSVRLNRTAYNLHGFTFTAEDLAAAIRSRIPDAAFDFRPDPAVDPMIRTWPDTMDDTAARSDWDWVPAYDFTKCVEAMFDLLGLQG